MIVSSPTSEVWDGIKRGLGQSLSPLGHYEVDLPVRVG